MQNKIMLRDLLATMVPSNPIVVYLAQANGENRAFKFFPEYVPTALYGKNVAVKDLFAIGGDIVIHAEEVEG